MFKKIIIPLLFLFSLLVSGEAKNKVVIKISCTIPPIIELNSAQKNQKSAKRDENKIIQEEKRKERDKIIIIRTVLLR